MINLERENKKLRESLAPFVRVASQFTSFWGYGDARYIARDDHEYVITIGDLLRAKAVYERAGEDK